MSVRASTSPPQSGHDGGSRTRTSTANCVRQPRHSPATTSRRSGHDAGRCAPSKPATTHISTVRRTTSFVTAADSSQLRTSPASSAQRSASIGAMTLHSNSAEALRTAGGAGPGVTGGAAAATQALSPQAYSARSPRTGQAARCTATRHPEMAAHHTHRHRTARARASAAQVLQDRRQRSTPESRQRDRDDPRAVGLSSEWACPRSALRLGERLAEGWRGFGESESERGRAANVQPPSRSMSPSMNQHPGFHQSQGGSQGVGILKHTLPMQTHV